MASQTSAHPAPMPATLTEWNVEDDHFWDTVGRAVAWRNLAISIPCLAAAFAIWMQWSIITVQMKNLGFPFSNAALFTLTAIAGLAGATLRIPNSFLIALAGGRNTIAFTTALLILPALGAGIALQSRETPYLVFVGLAVLAGFGGGNFASSMSNINFFFPRRMQGTALGLNAGFGNLGVSLMQAVIPLAMTVSIFGALGGAALLPPPTSGSPAMPIYIQNAGLVWVPVLAVLAVLAWFGMNNLAHVSPDAGHPWRAVGRISGLLSVGLAAAAIGVATLVVWQWNMWLVLPLTIMLTLLFMKLIPGAVRASLDRQFAIFRHKHNWIMTYLYVMTFGSFIGYSAAFPMLIRIVFGELPDGTPNPAAPNPFAFAWLGPLVGSLVRPIGGWLSDRFGGARVTHWDTVVMIVAALGAAFCINAAQSAAQPEQFFLPFLLLFLVLFITAGIGNGSTFRMIPIIFPPREAGPVLGWTSAIAAYGSFIIPHIFGQQIEAGTPANALYGFALYYLTCLGLNWYYYARKGAEIAC